MWGRSDLEYNWLFSPAIRVLGGKMQIDIVWAKMIQWGRNGPPVLPVTDDKGGEKQHEATSEKRMFDHGDQPDEHRLPR